MPFVLSSNNTNKAAHNRAVFFVGKGLKVPSIVAFRLLPARLPTGITKIMTKKMIQIIAEHKTLLIVTMIAMSIMLMHSIVNDKKLNAMCVNNQTRTLQTC